MSKEERIVRNREKAQIQKRFPWIENREYRNEVLPIWKPYKVNNRINYVEKWADNSFTDSRIGKPILYGR